MHTLIKYCPINARVEIRILLIALRTFRDDLILHLYSPPYRKPLETLYKNSSTSLLPHIYYSRYILLLDSLLTDIYTTITLIIFDNLHEVLLG